MNKPEWIATLKEIIAKNAIFDRLICASCGKKYPAFIMLQDELWAQICKNSFSEDCILCEGCMEWIAYSKGLDYQIKFRCDEPRHQDTPQWMIIMEAINNERERKT